MAVLLGLLAQAFQPLRFVKRVDLSCDYELRSFRELRIVRRQLVIDHFIVMHRVATRRRRNVHQVQKQLSPFDMSEKTITQPVSFVRALDQSRNVRNHKRAEVAHIYHAQMWLKSREWIVGNFRVGGGNSRDERRLAGVRKNDQTHIRKQFQLELEFKFLARTSFLVITRRAICRSRKVRIAETATPGLLRQAST